MRLLDGRRIVSTRSNRDPRTEFHAMTSYSGLSALAVAVLSDISDMDLSDAAALTSTATTNPCLSG